MKKTPLYSALREHKKLNRASFHTPGHKNSKKFMKQKFIQVDYTELPDTDSLYESATVIKEAEDLTAQLYGAKCTIFSAGGCTLCIQTMLKLALPYGGKVVASRMIHKSAVNTMALLNAEVEWVMPEFNKSQGCFEQIKPEKIENILQKGEKYSCVYITSPDYFGNIADVKKIAQICHQHGVPLLVDNAHGAHLKFLQSDLHPISFGADMVADSAHKTLPVLTGGAFLHIANEKYVAKAKQEMAIFGSTSPSYAIMASLDTCRAWLSKSGKKAFLKLEDEVFRAKKVAAEKEFLDDCGKSDPVRLTLNVSKIGIDGHKAAEYFRENGVEPEFSDSQRVVFIATPMNTKKDFARLIRAIKLLPVGESVQNKELFFDIPKARMSLHEALFSHFERVDVRESSGKISARTVCPCPPGIPILVPGEIITEISIKNLLYYRIFSIDVIK